MSDEERVPVSKGDMEDVCTCRDERIWHVVSVSDAGTPVYMHCIRSDCPCLQFEPDWAAAFGGQSSQAATNTPDRIDATKLNPAARYMHVLMGCVSVIDIIREFPLDALLQEMLASERVLQEQRPDIWQQKADGMVRSRKIVEAAYRFRHETRNVQINGG